MNVQAMDQGARVGAARIADRATLVVLPHAAAGGGDRVAPATRLLGLPLLRRGVLAARRAGFDQVLILTLDPGGARQALDGAPATVLPLGKPLPPLPRGRMVVVAENVLPSPDWLRALREMPTQPGQMLRDAEAAAVIDGADVPGALLLVGRGLEAPEFFAAAGRSLTQTFPPLGQEQRLILTTPGDVRGAEAWLLRGLLKEREGFMSRHLERRISLAITRRLAPTRIGPNAMTAVSLGIGLLGAPCFLSGSPGWQLTGALLFLLHSILDGCDGELARLRFQESRWGGFFDFWGDNLVHVAVFLCMAVGWSLAAQGPWPLLAGGSAVAGTLGLAGFVTQRSLRRRPGDGPLFTSVLGSRASRTGALLDALGSRDFIYAVVVFSAFGKAHWFLLLAAIGTPLFCLLVLWVARTEATDEARSA